MCPLIFVFGMDYLVKSVMISTSQNEFHPRCNEVKLCSLGPADLIMSCMEGTGVKCILAALTYLPNVLGLKSNLDKSDLVNGSIGSEMRADACDCKISTCTLPFRYFGMPDKPQRLNKQDCQIFMHRIATRIRKWPVKKLSYVD